MVLVMVNVSAVVAAALHMACVIQQKDARQWFAELAVDLEKVGIGMLIASLFRI